MKRKCARSRCEACTRLERRIAALEVAAGLQEAQPANEEPPKRLSRRELVRQMQVSQVDIEAAAHTARRLGFAGGRK